MTSKSLVDADIDVSSDEARAPRVPSAEEPAATAASAERAQDASPTDEQFVPEPTTLPADYALAPKSGGRAEEPLSPAWQEALDEAYDETEKQLIGVLARYDIEPPVIGDEYGAGIPLEIAWPERKVEIVGPDPETVLAALELTDGGDS